MMKVGERASQKYVHCAHVETARQPPCLLNGAENKLCKQETLNHRNGARRPGK